MKTQMQIINPEQIELELVVRMSYSHWKQLGVQLNKVGIWPASEMAGNIRELVEQAEKHFYPKPKSK